MHALRIADIIEDSIVDGPGIRLAVFTQGCPHHCPGCHNPQTHDFSGGRLIDIEEIIDLYAENPLLSGITFSGGEPFMQPGPLARLAKKAHEMGGDVVTYTGFIFEDLAAMRHNPLISDLLEETDILVDGPYIEALRSLELRFRGSSNQRLLTKEDRAEMLFALRLNRREGMIA